MPNQQVTKQHTGNTQTVSEKRWFYTNICCYPTTALPKSAFITQRYLWKLLDIHTQQQLRLLVQGTRDSSFFVQSKQLEERQLMQSKPN